jgi:hypothetical protein
MVVPMVPGPTIATVVFAGIVALSVETSSISQILTL